MIEFPYFINQILNIFNIGSKNKEKTRQQARSKGGIITIAGDIERRLLEDLEQKKIDKNSVLKKLDQIKEYSHHLEFEDALKKLQVYFPTIRQDYEKYVSRDISVSEANNSTSNTADNILKKTMQSYVAQKAKQQNAKKQAK